MNSGDVIRVVLGATRFGPPLVRNVRPVLTAPGECTIYVVPRDGRLSNEDKGAILRELHDRMPVGLGFTILEEP